MMMVDSTAPAAEASGGTTFGSWQPVGICGGGSMFAPAFSPVDPNAVMINCDMSAAYLSFDSGRKWQMIHHSQLGGNTFCRPVFHPQDSNTIFAASGWSGHLKVTHDHGQSWTDIGNLPSGLKSEVAIDPGHPALMLAGAQNAVWVSTDSGHFWSRAVGPKGTGIGFHFDQTSPADRRVCFADTSEGVWRSDDLGTTWIEKSVGLP